MHTNNNTMEIYKSLKSLPDFLVNNVYDQKKSINNLPSLTTLFLQLSATSN